MTDQANMRYISFTGSTYQVTVPCAKQKNFHRSRFDEAVEYRDKMCALVGIDLTKPYRKHYEANRKDKNHPWLPPGITLAKDPRSNSTMVRAYDRRSGKSIARSFGGKNNDRTFKEAMQEVIDWREEKGYSTPMGYEIPDEIPNDE